MPGKQKQRGDAGRAYSLGFELAAAVAGFVLLGIWIDRHFRTGPRATLICLLLGLIGGFYNLIRGASRMAREGRGPDDPESPKK
jgi:F0F1-type ATP synthase assembly protein I